jgi:hypothetical protein
VIRTTPTTSGLVGVMNYFILGERENSSSSLKLNSVCLTSTSHLPHRSQNVFDPTSDRQVSAYILQRSCTIYCLFSMAYNVKLTHSIAVIRHPSSTECLWLKGFACYSNTWIIIPKRLLWYSDLQRFPASVVLASQTISAAGDIFCWLPAVNY